MDIKIKKAKKNQVCEIAEVYALSFNSVGENWEKDKAEGFIQYLIEQQPDTFFVAYHINKLVGGIWGKIKPWMNGDNLSDIELFVLTEYQRNKISLRLYKALLQYAIDTYDIESMEGIVNGAKDFPLNYYKSLGRKESGFIHLYGDAKKVLKNVNERLGH